MNTFLQLTTAEKTKNRNIPKNYLYTWTQQATAVSKETNHIWKRNVLTLYPEVSPLCKEASFFREKHECKHSNE